MVRHRWVTMRVFFDFSDEVSDTTGVELTCLDEAESEAVAGLLAVAQDKGWDFRMPLSIYIRAGDGAVLSTATLSVTLTRNS